jgi:TolA-binding protein
MKATFQPYMRQTRAVALAVMDEKASYWMLVGILVSSFVLYAYLVNVTVHNVVRWQGLQTQISSLNMKLSQLEFQYISMKNDVTLDKAHALGFRDVSEPAYLSMQTAKASSLVAMNGR